MGLLLRAVILALFSYNCQGLELTFDRNSARDPSGRDVCGVLVCVEESHTAVNTSIEQDDVKSLDTTVSTISSLTIYRLDQTNSNNNTRRHTLIAAVTSQQPSVMRVSDGIKVDGHLKARRSTLRLEFVKQEDCQAEFTCQVRGVDTQGRQVVSSSHLVQQPGGKTDQADGESWTPEAMLRLLTLVKRLDTRPALLGQHLVNSEVGLNRLEHEIERSEDKIEHLEDKLDRLDSKIELLNRALSDDIKSLENRLEDKTESLKKELSDRIEQRLNTRLNSFESNILQVSGMLTQSVTEIRNSNSQCLSRVGNEGLEEIGRDFLDNLENDINTNFSNLTKDLLLTKNSLENEVQSVSMNINNSARETENLFRQLISSDSTRVRYEVHTIVSDLLRPTVCKKGMGPLVSQISFGYTVIYPNKTDILRSPYLCDTYTDGGGWIVIQRRTTGKVNFYRDWTSYKKGFGSLDEEFWLGNDYIFNLTNTGTYELRVDMKYQGKSYFAHYSTFSIGDEHSNYVLKLGSYDGTAGDDLTQHKGRQFSTHDRDNDIWAKNCAAEYTGAWWYVNCHHSNLNGKWGAGAHKGPRWEQVSKANAVSYTEMKIRPVN